MIFFCPFTRQTSRLEAGSRAIFITCELTLVLVNNRGRVTFQAIIKSKYFDCAVIAALSVLCGWLLRLTPLGETWTNVSYDYLFRFGARVNTDQVTLVLMDSPSADQLKETTAEQPVPARLLKHLADDGCRLAVFDGCFRVAHNARQDSASVKAMRPPHQVLLLAEQVDLSPPNFKAVEPTLPPEIIPSTGRTNGCVACLNVDTDLVVRRVCPCPPRDQFASMPLNKPGAVFAARPVERWLRYYGEDGPGVEMSCQAAFLQPTNYFRNQVVFIGTPPETTLRNSEVNEFATPYSGWTIETTPGLKIMATAFLNLQNDECLRRLPAWFELIILLLSGLALGSLARLKSVMAAAAAVSGAVGVGVCAISWSYFTNYWFPWLMVAGAQIPLTLLSALGLKVWRALVLDAKHKQGARKIPVTPGYELFHPPIGEGSYGIVWLARSKSGQWCALKAVYQEKFGADPEPFEREFDGVTRYQPISGKYPGLLRVDFVSEKQDGYFYYVMELGDSMASGWEKDAQLFKPHNLGAERARHQDRRLPMRDCLRIGSELAASLELFHQHELIHRDIKPENIMFVNGRPKFADFGLIADKRPTGQVKTFIGTAGYMPPPPEFPGTTTADIYALGMVLYVLSSGRAPDFFPAIATELVANHKTEDFRPLNRIITKACQPEPKDRYASAREMHADMLALNGK